MQKISSRFRFEGKMSEIKENNEPACKLLRLSPDSAKDTTVRNDIQSKALDLTSAQTALSTIHLKEDINLSLIKFVKVLHEDAKQKTIHIEGEYNGQKVVLILEKTSFGMEMVEKIIETTNKSLKKDFTNDIYGNYTAYPAPELNGIKAVIIHPATDLHIQKYSAPNFHLISESPDDYKNVTLSFLESQQFSLDWVYNILNHKSETERVLFEDEDKENGFMLVPDLRWDRQQTSNLHALAIIHKKGIKSLRDLNGSHLNMLINIKKKCTTAISQKYGVKETQLRCFVHYQPSFYHFHVHIQSLCYDAAGVDRCHLLDNVIQNILLDPDYYQKVTLTFTVNESQGLFKIYNSLFNENH